MQTTVLVYQKLHLQLSYVQVKSGWGLPDQFGSLTVPVDLFLTVPFATPPGLYTTTVYHAVSRQVEQHQQHHKINYPFLSYSFFWVVRNHGKMGYTLIDIIFLVFSFCCEFDCFADTFSK